MSAKRDTLHKIRNHLGALQTFLEIVELPDENEKLRRLQQTCKEGLEAINKLLKNLEC